MPPKQLGTPSPKGLGRTQSSKPAEMIDPPELTEIDKEALAKLVPTARPAQAQNDSNSEGSQEAAAWQKHRQQQRGPQAPK